MSRVAPAAYASTHTIRAIVAGVGGLDEPRPRHFRALDNIANASRRVEQVCADAGRCGGDDFVLVRELQSRSERLSANRRSAQGPRISLLRGLDEGRPQ